MSRIKGWTCSVCGIVRHSRPCECGACSGCCEAYVPITTEFARELQSQGKL